ncbi:phosphoadenylyl-sulfate reductase, partial [Escherichia coli]
MGLYQNNKHFHKNTAIERVIWALEHLPNQFVLSSSFGIQAAVCLHLLTRQYP